MFTHNNKSIFPKVKNVIKNDLYHGKSYLLQTYCFCQHLEMPITIAFQRTFLTFV